MEIGGKASLAVLEGLSANIGADDSLQVGGNLNVDVQGNTSFRADGETTIISGDEIKVQVGYAGLILKSSGNIKLYGSSITIDGAAQTTINGGNVAINPDKGSARLNVAPPYESFMRYNQRIVLQDQTTGAVHANKAYKLVFEDGKEIFGKTNAKGETSLINTKDLQSSFDIYWRETL